MRRDPSDRPGIPLAEDENLAAQLGEVLTTLRACVDDYDDAFFQALQTLEWVKNRLEEGFDPETGQRK
jgi:hypothetical protein